MEGLELNCVRCKTEFDTINRIPKMIISCGHTICNQCLLEIAKNKISFTCPEDKNVRKFY